LFRPDIGFSRTLSTAAIKSRKIGAATVAPISKPTKALAARSAKADERRIVRAVRRASLAG